MSGPKPAPTISQRIRALDWNERVDRSTGRRPMHDAEFVAELGREARIIDLRRPEELTGVLGHIPGAIPIALTDVAKIAERLDPDTPIILVSSDGERASRAALYLESLDMNYVAALRGGMRAWKSKGFAVSRDPAIHERKLETAGQLDKPPGVIEPGCKLSAEQIAWHVGQAGSVRWVKLAALILHGKAACIDGRDDHGVIGTPGGDAGEFTLALAAFEKVTGVQLSDEQISSLLTAWVDTFGHFYLHTDTPALDRFIKALRADERVVPHLGKVYEAREWRAYMAKPPLAVRELLLEHLVKPDHVGCGHLRLAMTNPSEYEVRPELLQGFLRAFFRNRWAGLTELEFVVLGGGHEEGAVVEVTLAGELWPHTRIPLLSPAVESMQMFVIHPQVARYLRRPRASFLANEIHADIEVDENRLLDEICGLADRQLLATAGRLAKGLPVYEVRFDRCGEFEVMTKQPIPG